MDPADRAIQVWANSGRIANVAVRNCGASGFVPHHPIDGWTVEVTSSLDPPVQWTRMSPGSGPPVSIAAGTAPLFMRLAK